MVSVLVWERLCLINSVAYRQELEKVEKKLGDFQFDIFFWLLIKLALIKTLRDSLETLK